MNEITDIFRSAYVACGADKIMNSMSCDSECIKVVMKQVHDMVKPIIESASIMIKM